MNTFSPYKRFVGSFLPNCLLQYVELNAIDKLVWARLAQFMGDSDYCYPKQKTLAFELGTTVLTVKRSLAKLEEKGFLKVKRADDISKMNGSGNKYYFLEHEIFSDSSGIKMILEGNEAGALRTRGRRTKRSGIKMIPVESKRIKQENQEHKKAPAENFLHLFPKNFQQDEVLISTWEEFLQFRRQDKKKPVSQISAKRIIDKLVQFNAATAVDMLNASIENGWTGVFPLKNNTSSRSGQVKYGHVAKEKKYTKNDIVYNWDEEEK